MNRTQPSHTCQNPYLLHFKTDFLLGLRRRQMLFLNYIFPLGFYLMMGMIMPGLNPMFLETMVPSMATFAILAIGLLGIPDPLVNAREQGIYRSYRIHGIPARAIVIIPIITSVLHMTIVGAIITTTAPLLFDAPAPVDSLSFAGVFLLTAFTVSSLGTLIGVVSSSTTVALMFSQVIFIPSMLIGGLMIPHSFLPAAARPVSGLLPTTFAMEAFQGLAGLRGVEYLPWGSAGGSALVLGVMGIIAVTLSVYLFSWDRTHGSRRASPLLGLLVLVPEIVGIILL